MHYNSAKKRTGIKLTVPQPHWSVVSYFYLELDKDFIDQKSTKPQWHPLAKHALKKVELISFVRILNEKLTKYLAKQNPCY